jgi:hypothetical protein
LDQHIEKLEFEYYNSINYLKNLSIKRFIEHVIEDEDPNITISTNRENSISRTEKIIVAKEDREKNLLSKFRSSISASLENMNIRNLIDLNRENNEMNESLIENDNVSVISSKFLQHKKNLKLPFIIGTHDFFKNEFLGIFNEELINISSFKRRNDHEFVLKNEFLENEIFINPTKIEEVKKTEEIPDLTKNHLYENPINRHIPVAPLSNEAITQNNENTIKAKDPVMESQSITPKEIQNVYIQDTEKQLKEPIIIPSNTITLNNFVKNSLFENNDEEDSLFKSITKTSKPTLTSQTTEEIVKETSNEKEVQKKINNLFSISEKDEKIQVPLQNHSNINKFKSK